MIGTVRVRHVVYVSIDARNTGVQRSLLLLLLALPAQVCCMRPFVRLNVDKPPLAIANGVELRSAGASMSCALHGDGLLDLCWRVSFLPHNEQQL